ncbi:MAG TPA: NAD(P)/FAD-dependent oxidoreductase [Steroidobacteraceae bacterium]|nr:NAD(P)/FAD-dependent oxidoreductase [Steroidobacteraceae bacterium]
MAAFDVAIIGAGAAGIAAGRQLQAAGRRIILLEARHRVGGRAFTGQLHGVPADLGAGWLHFAEENAWTSLAEAGGFTLVKRDPGWGPGACIGPHVPTAAEQAAAIAHDRHYNALVAAAAQAGRDVPLSQVLPQDAWRPRFDAVMTWTVGVETPSVSTIDLDNYAESRANWTVREGLGEVVAAAARELPVQHARVTRIDWSGATLQIDSSAGRIGARAAIVTVPTALLARDAILFHPHLPAAHAEAIANLPLGVCNKVFFRLREAGIATELPRHFLGSTSTSRTCSWSVNSSDHPLLMAYFGGDLSWELEQEGGLEAFARDEFTRLFGTDALSELGPALASAWGSDPLSLGSYSAARPGHASARTLLAAPVSPQLHFAGEACAVNHYGTLHGAWLSGVAAARRLL